MIDGCQADYIRVPYADSGLYLIPDNLTDEDVLFVRDILSTGYFGAENGNIKSGDTVAVFESGPVGMCAMATARLWGPARIVAVDIDQSRLGFVVKQRWADYGLNPKNVDVTQALKDMTSGRSADVTIEANGFEPTFKGAIAAVRAGGTVSLIGVFEKAQICEGYDIFEQRRDNAVKVVLKADA